MSSGTKTKTKESEPAGLAVAEPGTLRKPLPPQTAANHRQQLTQLNRISGQLEGIRRMIENQRYCPDIITQIHAACASLKSVSLNILEKHLENCLGKALANPQNPEEKQKKIQEVIHLLRRGR